MKQGSRLKQHKERRGSVSKELCIKCKKVQRFKHHKLCVLCGIEALYNFCGIKPIPEQYKKQAESLIHEIGQLADKLYPIISELGDNIEIECGNCIVTIAHHNSDKGE